ncbi:MAG TPA: hypothetical protein VHM90_07840, partial [Phycisphaerae bacterium]|nr:hypothetical protein [Phycisphaerae bacterium]
ALPCVVHEHPVMRWMIGEGGVALDLRGANGLRSALGTLLNDARRRRELGAAAREHCVKHFGRDAVVSAIVRYYHDVMRARPREGCGNDAEGSREGCGNDVEGPRERCGTGA